MVASALIKRGLSKYRADDLLKFLQREDKLCSDPTQNFLNVRFPIPVIEGKAYATGKSVFEAENQVAVSGSCIINLQKTAHRSFQRRVSNFRTQYKSRGREDTSRLFHMYTGTHNRVLGSLFRVGGGHLHALHEPLEAMLRVPC